MNSDDSMRNTHYSSNRKPGMTKSQGYSPSMNYNYNGNQAQHGNHGNHSSHGNHGNHGNSNYSNQQHQRRKPNQFKRDNHGANDRLVKQNDIIIRLLKEIRDRLPAPPAVEQENVEESPETTASVDQEKAQEAVESGEKAKEPAKEKVTEPAGASDDDSFDDEVNGNV